MNAYQKGYDCLCDGVQSALGARGGHGPLRYGAELQENGGWAAGLTLMLDSYRNRHRASAGIPME